MKVKKIKRSSVILGIVLGAVLGVYVLSLFWMLGWGLITSLKDDIYFLRHVIGLPDKWMWSNYIRAFNSFLVNVTTSSGIRTVYLEEMFLNSVLYALGCAIASTTCACVMAYLSARFAYKFSKVTYTVVVVAMIVPHRRQPAFGNPNGYVAGTFRHLLGRVAFEGKLSRHVFSGVLRRVQRRAERTFLRRPR